MYTPTPFKVTDKAAMLAFIRSHPFAQLTSGDGLHFDTSFLPFMVGEGEQCLLGHLARHNEHAERLDGQRVCATFMGPHGYISPTWYERPGVPTWDYMVVKVVGTATIIDDVESVKGVVETLSTVSETHNDTNWDANYAHDMLKSIVGVSVSIDQFNFTAKLSQNKSRVEIATIVKALRAKSATALADAIEAHNLSFD